MTLCAERGLPHRWVSSVTDREEHCLYCSAKKTRVDWNQPLEPGPVKIDTSGDERKLCEQDAQQLGVGYLVDGKRVHPSRVTVFVLKPGGAND